LLTILLKSIGNTNTNINFKKGLQYQYQYFFCIAESIPILALEETVLTLSLTLSLPRNYRSISHCYGQPTTTDWHCLDCRIYVPKMDVCLTCWGYRSSSPTAIQAWRPCPLWEPSHSHPIVLVYRLFDCMCVCYCIAVFCVVCFSRFSLLL